MIPIIVWMHVATKTRKLEIKQNPKCPQKAYKGPEVGSVEELQREFIASIIHSTYHVGNTADHWFNGVQQPGEVAKHPDQDLGFERRWGVSHHRFWKVRKLINFDWQRVADAFNESWSEGWVLIGGSGIVTDEALMATLAKEAPKIFLARKPHNTGIRFYLVCVKFHFSRRPFCIHIIPDLKADSSLGVKEILERSWKIIKQQPWAIHLTADAFFGLAELIDSPPDDLYFTMSWNSGRKKDLWISMMHNIGPKTRENRVAYRERDGLVVSVFRDEGNMLCVSNVVTLDPADTVQQINGFIETTEDGLEGHDEPSETIEADQIKFCFRCQRTRPAHETIVCRAKLCPNIICNRCPKSKEILTDPKEGQDAVILFFCETSCKTDWRDDYSRRINSNILPPTAGSSSSSNTLPPLEYMISPNSCSKIAATTISKDTLTKLARRLGVSEEGTKKDLAFRIGGWACPPAALPTPSNPPQTSTANESSSSSSSTSESTTLEPD